MRSFNRFDNLFFTCILFCGTVFSSCSNNTDAMRTSAEMKIRSKWVKEHLLNAEPQLPFSFLYDGETSSELLKSWQKRTETNKLDNDRTQYTHIWKDNETGLEVRCVSVEYSDFPTVEWTLYFRNTGAINTPILQNIQPLNTLLNRGGSGEFTLHHTIGDGGNNIYKPDPIQLAPGTEKRYSPDGGRPCSGEFPYFNVEWNGGGTIIAIGWPGQWKATFENKQPNGLLVTAGQELTHFKLLPGEEVRSPLIVTQFWTGDQVRSQNLWRRWMISHNLPRIGDKPVAPQMNVCNGNQYNLFGITEENQRAWIDRYNEEGIKFDFWWCDLGWFSTNTNTYVFNALYDPDTARFPKGLKPLSEYLHKNNVKLIAWFEPEHYYPGTGNWICDNHPDWLLKAPPGHEKEINQGLQVGNRVILNMGNPDALKWVVNNVDRVIREQGIDLYRHDFNIEPLIYWRENDTPDRQGITEIKYVTGFLKYYDELLTRHTGLIIDNCASGGRRNDIETLRRSVPLLRSDTWGEPVGQQCQTYGLTSWIPYWGTGIIYSDPKDLAYIFRSQMGPSFTSCWELTPDANYDLHRKLLFQWESVRDHILCSDFYPLTPYSSAKDTWMAWQFDSPEQGDGIIQAFRRDSCGEPTMTVRLNRLNPKAQYEVTNFDKEGSVKVSGRELIEKGLIIEINNKPGSALITYKLCK